MTRKKKTDRIRPKYPGGGILTIHRFLTAINRRKKFTHGEIEKIVYSWNSIKNDLSKLMIMMGIASLFGIGGVFIFVLGSYTTIRIFNGGLHENSYWKCFFATAAWLFSGTGIALVLRFSRVIYIITCVCLLLVFVIGPIQSERKRKMTDGDIHKRKTYTIIAGITLIVLSSILPLPEPCRLGLHCGIWMETIQIAILFLYRRR